jgi:hypothetical protein
MAGATTSTGKKEVELMSMERKKNAFRAFGATPRSCLGQELAMMEMKAAVALIVREFDLGSVLEGEGRGAVEVQGERVHQAQVPGQPTPHPKG